MPSLEAIADAGPWALFAFLALLVIGALIHGDLVPGFVNKREVLRGDRLEAEGVRLARHSRRMERERDRAREQLRAHKAAARRGTA